jgi:peptide deformylase
MAVLSILEYPDTRLRARALPVTQFDQAGGQLGDDMLQTMYSAPGIGLAATQVGVRQQVLVIDISEERNQPLVFVNPQIVSREGTAKTEEGCLSVPGVFDEVERASKVRVLARDRNGEAFEQDLEGQLAVCLQHEMDHLDGKLFVDYLSDLKRERIRKKLEKDRKEKAAGRRPAAAQSVRAY